MFLGIPPPPGAPYAQALVAQINALSPRFISRTAASMHGRMLSSPCVKLDGSSPEVWTTSPAKSASSPSIPDVLSPRIRTVYLIVQRASSDGRSYWSIASRKTFRTTCPSVPGTSSTRVQSSSLTRTSTLS
eukprot:scaffold13898_cov30-Tisochrysis_lutea.AAC.4